MSIVNNTLLSLQMNLLLLVVLDIYPQESLQFPFCEIILDNLAYIMLLGILSTENILRFSGVNVLAHIGSIHIADLLLL